MKNCKGFTLMELLIVIAIITILAGVLVARMSSQTEKTRDAKRLLEMEGIITACRSYYADTGIWPDQVVDLILPAAKQGYNEDGNPARRPKGSWNGPYLEVEGTTVPKDPEGNNYVIRKTGKNLYIISTGSGTEEKLLIHSFAVADPYR